MTQIWKYMLKEPRPGTSTIIKTPGTGLPLKVAKQGDIIFVWAKVVPGQEEREMEIKCVATGEELGDLHVLWQYLDTVLVGPFVWHYFWVAK
jgi:hypothetical protein